MADPFTAFERELGAKPATVGLAWVMSHPTVTAPIIRARNLSQPEDSLAALEVEMMGELREKISALSPTPAPATDGTETLKTPRT